MIDLVAAGASFAHIVCRRLDPAAPELDLSLAWARGGESPAINALLEMAFQVVGRPKSRVSGESRANSHREALGAASGAEGHFQNALHRTRQQGILSMELRCATGLARLWHAQGRSEPARDLLAPIYTHFTEGFGTAGLMTAKGAGVMTSRSLERWVGCMCHHLPVTHKSDDAAARRESRRGGAGPAADAIKRSSAGSRHRGGFHTEQVGRATSGRCRRSGRGDGDTITHHRMSEQSAKEMGFETSEYDEEQAQIAEEKKSNADAGGAGITNELASATVGLNVTPTGVTPKRSAGPPSP